jgi:hypothetical protein
MFEPPHHSTRISPHWNQSWQSALEINMGQRRPPKPGQNSMISSDVVGQEPAAAGPLPEGGMEPELQDHIGRQLRAIYDEVLDEPVPERFLKLLADLDNKQGPKS